MTLSTARIGIAIRDLLEGKDIDSDPANRDDPYGDERAFIEFVDVSDPDNPVLYTDQGIFKIIILKIGDPGNYVPPKPKQIRKNLLWEHTNKGDPDETD